MGSGVLVFRRGREDSLAEPPLPEQESYALGRTMRMNDQNLLAPDGTRIAFGWVGSGPPLLLTNGLTTSSSFWKYLRPIWQAKYTVITWDLPGHGDSAPSKSPEGATIEALPNIMARILDAVGVEQAVQIGWSVGSQVVLEMYRQWPQRVRALVTLFGPAGRALESTRLPISGKRLEQLARHARAERVASLLSRLVRVPLLPGVTALLRRAQLIGQHTSNEDLREILDHVARIDPKTLPLMTLSAQLHSAYDLLPAIAVPWLIMAAARDPFMPLEAVAVPMHRAAPGSELVVLKEATHAALLDFPDQIAEAVEGFLTRRLA
jgi:3-oxoadipate enol-lactonase